MNIKRSIVKKEKNKILKAGIWYTICNFFVKGISFLTLPIFTRILTKNEIGLFSNVLSWFNILAIITTFEIYSSVSIARFDYKENLNEYISSSLVLGTIITFIYYVIVLIFHNFFENLLMMDFLTLNIVFIYLLVYPAFQMYQIKSQINYKYKNIILSSLISVLSSTVLSICLAIFMKNSLIGRTVGYFIPLIITSIIIYIMLLKDSNKMSTKYWKYALRVSVPLIFHLLAGYVLSASDKIMITKLISAEANASYSVAYSVSQIASILWLSTNNVWSPWAYSKMDEKNYFALKNNSKPYTLFFVFIVFVLMIIAPEILYVMGGKKYIDARYVIPCVMVGYIIQFVYSFYVNIEFYHKKQTNIAIGTIIAALINIVLNFIFIPKIGYIAAAYTTLIGYMSLLIIHYLFVKKLRRTNWYDTKFFVIIILVSLLFMVVCNILYKYNTLRYSIICVIILIVLCVMYKRRKEIFKALKNKSVIELYEALKIV